MLSITLRNLFSQFWQGKNHQEVAPVGLIPKDETTLFTSSGMQQLVPYLKGKPHSQGKRLYNIQPCFRAVDIEEVGDSRHTTFFEMMGNWSLGDYFKEEQLEWFYKFLTEIINLPPEKLFVTVFKGNKQVPKDEESALIWKKLGIPESRIFYYGVDKNWWSRSGTPNEMPVGEIGGPDSEVFYDFGTPHDKKYGNNCHPNCDCGRFLEIGNSVFIQYRKKADGSLEELPQKNVDFGGGLERILAACANNPDIFQTDAFKEIITTIEKVSGKNYSQIESQFAMQIIADHIKASIFLITNGIKPSNKTQGYILRRLLRRAAVKLNSLEKITNEEDLLTVADSVLSAYDGIYFNKTKDKQLISSEIGSEIFKFTQTLKQGLKIIDKTDSSKINAKFAFDLFQSCGFPFEITQELMSQKGIKLNKEEFDQEFKKHQNLSRTSSVGMFKSGLADSSEQVIKYHTATHLLLQALRDVLGSEVKQAGSNITSERLRFDFSYDKKPKEEEIKKIENIVNQKIKEALTVYFKTMSKNEAEKTGALASFSEKYGYKVKVYFIGDYSKELCNGPHVKNTSEIGSFKIIKVKKIGGNLMRIYAG